MALGAMISACLHKKQSTNWNCTFWVQGLTFPKKIESTAAYQFPLIDFAKMRVLPTVYDIFSYFMRNMVKKHYFENILDENLIWKIWLLTLFIKVINVNKGLLTT